MNRSTKIAIGIILFTFIASAMLLLDDSELRHSTDLRDHRTLPVGGGERYRQLTDWLTRNEANHHSRYPTYWERAFFTGPSQRRDFFEQYANEIVNEHSKYQVAIDQLFELTDGGMIGSDVYDHSDQNIYFWSDSMKFHRLLNANADWLLLQQSPDALDEPVAFYRVYEQLLPNAKNYADYDVCLSVVMNSQAIWRIQLPKLSREQLETLRELLSRPIDFLTPLQHVVWAEYCDLAHVDEQAVRLEFAEVERYRLLYQPRNTLNRYGDFIHPLSESLGRRDLKQARAAIDHFVQSLDGLPVYNYPGVIMLRQQTIHFDTILDRVETLQKDRADLLVAIDARLTELEASNTP